MVASSFSPGSTSAGLGSCAAHALGLIDRGKPQSLASKLPATEEPTTPNRCRQNKEISENPEGKFVIQGEKLKTVEYVNM